MQKRGLAMASPAITLGVVLMDRDHEHLESLLNRVTATADEDLLQLFEKVETETRAHFDREEELMRSAGAPVICCHIEQHKMFLAEFAHGRDAIARDDMADLRLFLSVTLPQLFLAHIGSVDRITASFLKV
jgi:hemerythrin-like metal-binding protein